MDKFLSVKDIGNLDEALNEAFILKENPLSFNDLGKNKTLCLLFFNASLRTRLSTQIAGQNLGMNIIVMNINEDGWKIEIEFGVVMDGNKAEHIKEAAGVIGRYCDIIGIRAFPSLTNRENDYAEPILSQFIKYANTPIISLEGATNHPLQAFADVITIEQYKTSEIPKVVLTWAPHPKALPQSVSNSFAEWSIAAGYNLVITHPEGYELNPEFTEGARIEYDQKMAFEDADFIYAKNWSSYKKYGNILSTDRSWMVDRAKMDCTNNAKFLHCLPVRRNMIVSDEVLDSKSSVVIEQAANRVISAQVILKKMLETKF
ncbi:acetylornithine carbamoyltransferase [Bacteroidota bacterium]